MLQTNTEDVGASSSQFAEPDLCYIPDNRVMSCLDTLWAGMAETFISTSMSLWWTPLSFSHFVCWGFLQLCISGKWLVMLAIHHVGYHIPRGSGPRQSALFVWPIAAFRKSNASKMHLATHFVAAGVISQGCRCSSASWPQIQAAPVPRLCGRASGNGREGTLWITQRQFSLSLWKMPQNAYILTEKKVSFLW